MCGARSMGAWALELFAFFSILFPLLTHKDGIFAIVIKLSYCCVIFAQRKGLDRKYFEV